MLVEHFIAIPLGTGVLSEIVWYLGTLCIILCIHHALSWASIHKADGRLIAWSRQVSKPRYWMLQWSYRSEDLQASRQRCCKGACQIAERLERSKQESRCFEASRDLVVRRPSASWIEAQSPILCENVKIYSPILPFVFCMKTVYMPRAIS